LQILPTDNHSFLDLLNSTTIIVAEFNGCCNLAEQHSRAHVAKMNQGLHQRNEWLLAA
jgi:hypothetical protein